MTLKNLTIVPMHSVASFLLFPGANKALRPCVLTRSPPLRSGRGRGANLFPANTRLLAPPQLAFTCRVGEGPRMVRQQLRRAPERGELI